MASQYPGNRPPYDNRPPYSPPPSNGGFMGRLTNILTKPAQEWRAIDAEHETAMQTFVKWAVPLAAIGPVCSFIGLQVFGLPILGRVPFTYAIVSAVLSYAAALAGVWILAFIVDLLAPTFRSQKDINRSMRLAAYAMTPAWVAGVLMIIPMLSILAMLAGLYGLYLFWVGLPILKKTPADQVVPYALVAIVANIVASVVLFFIVRTITAAMLVTAGGMGTGVYRVGSVVADGLYALA